MNNQALFNLYLDSTYEDKETAAEFLEKSGIDIAAAKEELLHAIKSKKAEFEIKKGAELQQNFDSALARIKNGFTPEEADYQYKVAARNFESLSEHDRKIAEENLKAVKKME